MYTLCAFRQADSSAVGLWFWSFGSIGKTHIMISKGAKESLYAHQFLGVKRE
jgi:hypothetical protein